MVMPLAPGDYVWAMFSEGGTGEFRTSGTESEPFDVTRQAITYPYCIPGGAPDPTPIFNANMSTNDRFIIGCTGQPSAYMEITHSKILLGNNPTDYVALASKVDAFIQVFAAWTPSGTVADATALKTALTAAHITSSYSVAATDVKAK